VLDLISVQVVRIVFAGTPLMLCSRTTTPTIQSSFLDLLLLLAI